MKRCFGILTVIVLAMLFTSCQSIVPTYFPYATASIAATPPGGETATATPTLSTPVPAPVLNAVLSEVEGGVEAKQAVDTAFVAAHDGTVLQEQDQVRTLEDGSTRLDLSTGTLIRMAPLSYFTLTENQPADNGLLTRIKLEFGQLWVILSGGSVEIETPSGQAAVRGSYMMVRIDPDTLATLVSCLEGTCELQNPAGTLRLGTGQLAELLPPELTGGQYRLPDIRPMSEQDLQDWLDVNPESAQILPAVRIALAEMPTREPILETPLTPGGLMTQIAEATLPGILPTTSGDILPTPGGILPTRPGILPTIAATRTPRFGN